MFALAVGGFKRLEPDLQEEALLMRALRGKSLKSSEVYRPCYVTNKQISTYQRSFVKMKSCSSAYWETCFLTSILLVKSTRHWRNTLNQLVSIWAITQMSCSDSKWFN